MEKPVYFNGIHIPGRYSLLYTTNPLCNKYVPVTSTEMTNNADIVHVPLKLMVCEIKTGKQL